jgi:hypothetical protein
MRDSGFDVTVYAVIPLPPSLAGAVHVTVAFESPGTAETAVGAPETVNGVTEPDAAELNPFPAAFVAKTVNV